MHSSLPNLSENIRWSLDLRYNPIGQPTGRAWFPGFIARSKSKPESEMNGKCHGREHVKILHVLRRVLFSVGPKMTPIALKVREFSANPRKENT